jgi:hypothetical protein
MLDLRNKKQSDDWMRQQNARISFELEEYRRRSINILRAKIYGEIMDSPIKTTLLEFMQKINSDKFLGRLKAMKKSRHFKWQIYYDGRWDIIMRHYEKNETEWLRKHNEYREYHGLYCKGRTNKYEWLEFCKDARLENMARTLMAMSDKRRGDLFTRLGFRRKVKLDKMTLEDVRNIVVRMDRI